MEPADEEAQLTALEKLRRDLVQGGRGMSVVEARFLVDQYYRSQDARIALGSQRRSAEKRGEPHALVSFFGAQFSRVEGQVRRALTEWVEQFEESRWAMSVRGVGPVLAAGLKAHIDLHARNENGVLVCGSVSKLWAYFGYAPGVVWEKGRKRPWCEEAKVLGFNIGECFVRVQNRPDDFYGKLYAKRKEYERARNERGELADQAAASIGRLRRKGTPTYKAYAAGKLPDGRIHARARRWVVKLFLSHYWQVSREIYGLPADVGPYVKDHLHHADLIPPPNWKGPAAKRAEPTEEHPYGNERADESEVHPSMSERAEQPKDYPQS